MNIQEKKAIVDLQVRVKSLENQMESRKKRFEKLIDTLVRGEVIINIPGFKYAYFGSCKPIEQRLQAILEHLDLEFEWVECESHFELKEKKEK